MSLDHTITREWGDGTSTLTQSKTQTDGLESNLSKEVADGEVDKHFSWPIDVSTLKSLHMQSDQDITVETNNPAGTSAAADQTFTLLAGQPISWGSGDAVDNPITDDITDIYITNASGSAAQLEFRALMDPTL